MSMIKKVILVDPDEVSRFELQQLLGGMGSVCLVEVCTTYDDLARAVKESPHDLVVVVLDADIEAALETIRRARAADPGLQILPASHSVDGQVILRALRAGAHEFLPLPTNSEEVQAAIERLLPENKQQRAEAQLLAVTGASGGVGCTTLAVNLASSLAKMPGTSVALVDLDLLLSAVDTSLDISAEQTIVDIVTEVDRLDVTLLRRALTRHASGIHVLPGPAAMEDATRVDPEALRKVFELLKQAFSFIVIDTSKSFQATDFVAFEMADTLLLVTQLELCCLRNSARLLQLFRQCDDLADRVQVVMNRVGSDITAIGLKRAEETLGAKAGWQIPNASNIIGAARSKGVPIDAESPSCRTVRAIQDMARSFLPQEVSETNKSKLNLRRISALFT